MSRRKIVIILILAFSIAMLLIIYIPRVGKIKVTTYTSPSDSQLTLDGVEVSPGSMYINGGEHTFTATKDGWTTDTITVDITDSNNTIALIQDPTSNDIELSDEDISYRESLAAIRAGTRGTDIRTKNPILEKLPYSDLSGPYKIDYGFNTDDEKTIYLEISYSTPNGRKLALNWLQDNGLDITKTEIIFVGFTPSLKGRSHE